MYAFNKAYSRKKEKFIALFAYIQKEESSEFNHLSSYLRKLEKEEEIKFKENRWKEIIKMRAEAN